ncbi:MAG TPA: hypothetical protein VMT54_10640 [Candidatus Cybelea sp.]|nr:hypothetical protein [Candidatus Cybelea sp.]
MDGLSRSILVLMAASAPFAVLSGCQSHQGQPVRTSSWGWYPEQSIPAAATGALEQDGILFVGCLSHTGAGGGKVPIVGIWSGSPAANDAMRLPALMLGYDGQPPQVQPGWTFDLAGTQISNDSRWFADVIGQLKVHNTVEAVIVNEGIEERRRRFSLEGAGPAIDEALSYCGL